MIWPGDSQSSAFKICTYLPWDKAMPLLKPSLMPLSGSVCQKLTTSVLARMISSVPSVEQDDFVVAKLPRETDRVRGPLRDPRDLVAGLRDCRRAVNPEHATRLWLGCEPGEPILLIDRVALGVDGTRAEWRRSLCRTDRSHYLSELK